jgi:GT2 family glycosyltransferase
VEKNKKIYLCIPTLTQYHLLNICLDSAERGSLVPDKYIIIDNGLGYVTKHSYEDKKTVIKPEYNLGCARSWNYFIKNYSENDTNVLLIVNDDVEFYSDSIEKLVNAYYENINNEEIGIIAPEGQSGNLYSCFILNQNVFKEIGEFDETFYPAYYEDSDYDYRMKLKSKKPLFVENCSYIHHHSATLKAYTDDQLQKHHQTFTANKNYFISKWGGDIRQEKFINPFNRD